VRTGALRTFRQHELGVDVVLASACLPLLFQAVEIDGEAYWDGGYAGNPTLLPLINESPADDLLLVQINPSLREELPTRATPSWTASTKSPSTPACSRKCDRSRCCSS
jgi:NTE family protein